MTLLEEIPSESFREASIPVLETERLVMRAPRLVDAKAISTLAADRRIAENTARIPHPYHLSDAEGFVDGANRPGGECVYLITQRDGAVMGACSIAQQDGAPEIGCWLGVNYWGKGFGTEAVHALVDYAFNDLGHDALHAGARVTNPASRRMLEKCGFQWTGVGLYRIHSIKSSAPIDRFRLDRGIWSALKGWASLKRVS